MEPELREMLDQKIIEIRRSNDSFEEKEYQIELLYLGYNLGKALYDLKNKEG